MTQAKHDKDEHFTEQDAPVEASEDMHRAAWISMASPVRPEEIEEDANDYLAAIGAEPDYRIPEPLRTRILKQWKASKK